METILMVKARSFFAAAGRVMTDLRSLGRVPSLATAKEALLCLWRTDGRLLAARVSTKGAASLIEVPGSAGLRPRRGPVIAILPKSQYIVKTIESPQVTPREAPAMIRLEAEASLPPEFGHAEVSYIQMPPEAGKSGRLRFEVYMARDESLMRLAETFKAAGLIPDMILPSAIAWRGILGVRPDIGMLVAEFPGGELETVVRQSGGGGFVRMVERQEEHDSEIPKGVVESIRSLLATAGTDEPHTILWSGTHIPRQDLKAVRFEGVRSNQERGSSPDGEDILSLIWSGLRHCPAADLRTVALRPRFQEERRRQRAATWRWATTIGAMLLGLLLVQTSFWVLGARYRTIVSDLNQQVARIRTEGGTTEKRLKQLTAAAAARDRQHDFQRLLAALYEYTPEGISYSEIAMDNSGMVRLRGQARSMAQPFLLPGALEGKGPLTHVVVKGAGLSKTSGGTITEFKAELVLRREG